MRFEFPWKISSGRCEELQQKGNIELSNVTLNLETFIGNWRDRRWQGAGTVVQTMVCSTMWLAGQELFNCSLFNCTVS